MVSSLTVVTMLLVEAMNVSRSSFCFFWSPDSINISDIITRLFKGSLILWEKSVITSSFLSLSNENSFKDSLKLELRLEAFLTIIIPVSYTHLRAHETVLDLVCRLLLE